MFRSNIIMHFYGKIKLHDFLMELILGKVLF